jgi:hypothetical protein
MMPGYAAVSLRKRFEDRLQTVSRNTRAGIGNLEPQLDPFRVLFARIHPE